MEIEEKVEIELMLVVTGRRVVSSSFLYEDHFLLQQYLVSPRSARKHPRHMIEVGMGWKALQMLQ